MVTISGFQQRKNAKGITFIILELEGSLQIQPSQTTGNLYASVCRCSIPCTFDEQTASELVGTTLPGEIIRVPCQPYTFINPETKEPVTLDYKYSYKASGIASNEPRNASRKGAEIDVV
jgi:hypothetical protein